MVKVFERFKQGDLIFGLAEDKRIIESELEKRGITHTYANTLNGPAVDLLMGGTSKPAAEKKLDAAQFKHFQFLLYHNEYLKRVPGRTVPARLDDPVIGAAYRRACKLLLINREHENRRYVVTDGVDWQRVFDKKKSGLGVTDSELRALYRDEIRHGRNPHVLFCNKKGDLLPESPWTQPAIQKIAKPYHDYILSKDAKKKRKKHESEADGAEPLADGHAGPGAKGSRSGR